MTAALPTADQWDLIAKAFEIGLSSYTTVILPNDIAGPLRTHLEHYPAEQIAATTLERDELLNGKRAVVPQSREHATKLYTVAVACMKGFGVDPEAEADRMRRALTEIASLTQTEKLLWWQERARAALGLNVPASA